MSLDEEMNVKEPKRRSAREWWKEEYCDELVRKKKKNKKKQWRESSTHNLNNNNWWQKMMRCMSIIERRRGVGARAGVVEVVLIGGWMDLVLVVIAGQRPLQVGGSPMSEFQRAILLWARHLARAGKLIDIVDHSIQDMDKEQALVCITVALLCLHSAFNERNSGNAIS
ncbi:hypothetical protein Tco_1334385 [Tanacetum coccineum]